MRECLSIHVGQAGAQVKFSVFFILLKMTYKTFYSNLDW